MPLLAIVLTIPLAVVFTFVAFFISARLFDLLELLGIKGEPHPLIGATLLFLLILGAHWLTYRVLASWQPTSKKSIQTLTTISGIIISVLTAILSLIISGIS